MAPLTSALGQWSPPIASTAIVSIDGCGLRYRTWLLFGDFDDFAALVLAALRAGAMRQFRLVAVRALRRSGQAQVIVRAAGRGAPLGMSTFRIRHRFFLLLFSAFRPSNRAARSSVRPPASVSHWHWPVFLFNPHCGQIPWHSSLQICCMGSDSRTYSRRTSASSIPPPS